MTRTGRFDDSDEPLCRPGASRTRTGRREKEDSDGCPYTEKEKGEEGLGQLSESSKMRRDKEGPDRVGATS